jgi:hypothetical protein
LLGQNIRRDTRKFGSFAVFSQCALFHLTFYPKALNFILRIRLMPLFSLSAFEDEFLLSQTFSIKRRLLMRNLPFYQGLLTLKGQNYEKINGYNLDGKNKFKIQNFG